MGSTNDNFLKEMKMVVVKEFGSSANNAQNQEMTDQIWTL